MNVHYGDILVKYGEVLDVKKDGLTYLLDASIVKKYQASLLHNGDLIIADAAEDETVGKCSEIVGLTDEIVLSGLHTIPCRPKGKYAEGFLGYYMNSNAYHDQLLPLLQGTKVYSISKSAIQDTDIIYPKSEIEQEQIGTYFKNLDHLITLHQRKSNALFCDFNYVWEQRKLGEVFEQVSNFVNPNEGDVELWSLTVEDGLTPKSERYNREFLVKKEDNFKEVRPGEIVYNPMNMTLGAVGYNKMSKSVAVSGYYTTMITKDHYDSYYINTWLKSPQAILLYKAYATGSLIEKQRVQFPTLSIIPAAFPNFEEQKKIGEYFTTLDNLITLHQCKCNLCLNFTMNDWEQRKFGDLVGKYEDPVETPTNGYMRLGIRSHAKGTFHSFVEEGKELETAKMFRVAANNFIVNITFGWEHAVAITDENDAGKLVSHRFPQYQFHKGMVPKFFRYLILDECFKHHLELSSPGGAGRNRVLKLGDMLEYRMKFPSKLEQEKIAFYFDNLDNLITLHQCEHFGVIIIFEITYI